MKNWNYVDDNATESPKQPNGGCYALNTEQKHDLNDKWETFWKQAQSCRQSRMQ